MSGTAARRISALGAVAVLLATVVPWLPATAATAPKVIMTVVDVSPNSPTISSTPQPLMITLRVQNMTEDERTVTVAGARGEPIFNQHNLDQAIAHPVKPSDDQRIDFDKRLTIHLAPYATETRPYTITTDVPVDSDLCLCADAIYPLYFQAIDKATDAVLATTQTYVPSFTGAPDPPAKEQVGWMWPLLERPHRLRSDTLFVDDGLASAVAAGGRLDRLLQVAQDVAPDVPLTIVTDPELIDELAVMITGYRVRAVGGAQPGTGGPAAAAWLVRLRTLLAEPGVELSFTPQADPPVDALSQAGLTWSTQPLSSRVTDALGANPPNHDVYWPLHETISANNLADLVSHGTKTVILNDQTLPKGRDAKIVPDALAPVSTASGSITAAVTSVKLDRLVRDVFAPDGAGLSVLPELVAQLAMRVVLSHDIAHFVVLIPPRNLIVDPEVAERTIRATSESTWSTPLAVHTASTILNPVDHGKLHPQAPAQLPRHTANALNYVSQSLPGLQHLFIDADLNDKLQVSTAAAVTRAESTALLYEPAQSIAFATTVEAGIRKVVGGARLVRPSVHTYTLASRNSRLPITVTNRLPNPIEVVIDLSSAVGFTADPVARPVEANSTVQVRVPTTVDRVGLFVVEAHLSTRDGLGLGGRRGTLTLDVHSTALGTVGVVITIVAAAVLVLALLVRIVRRIRQRRRPPSQPPAPDPVPAATASS